VLAQFYEYDRFEFTILKEKCMNFNCLWCKEEIDFINVIGNRHIAESGDSKSKKFLFEKIFFAIQCGNAASMGGTFPDSALLSEIFVL
jgi:hypothetical protein